MRQKMKRFNLIFVMFQLFLSSLYSHWEECNNGLLNLYTDCLATKGNVIYAGTKSGIFYSTDKGDNWELLNETLSNLWVRCIAIDDTKMIVGTNGGLFVSTDAGVNFIRKFNGLPNNSFGYTSIVITDSVFIVGIYERGVYFSTDNGDTWIQRNNGIQSKQDLLITSIKDKFFAGTNEDTYISTNYGYNWIPTGLKYMAVRAFATDDTNLWVGSLKGVYLSTNYGESWIDKNYELENTIILSLIVNSNIVFIGTGVRGSSPASVYVSTDYGNNWVNKNIGLSPELVLVLALIIRGEYVFAGTDSGIYRAKLSEITDVEDDEMASIPLALHPNPASEYIEINIERCPTLSKCRTSVIRIYNALGECVINYELRITNYDKNARIDVSHLPAGIYYLRFGRVGKMFVKM